MFRAPIQMSVSEGLLLALSTNWLKRTGRLLCRKAEINVKHPDTFVFG
jgi:hypothetical protein